MPKLLFAILVALVVLRGLYLLAASVRNLRFSVASLQWPTAEGRIERIEDKRSDVVYSTRAIVRFPVNGVEYTTDLISFGKSLHPFDRTEAGLQRVRYPDGVPVKVSYRPNDPSTAVLRPGMHAEAFRSIGVALSILLPGFVWLCLLPAMSRGMERAADSGRVFKDMAGRAELQGGYVRERSPSPAMPSFRNVEFLFSSVGMAVLGSALTSLGMLALASGLPGLYWAYVSRNWSTVDGQVEVNVGYAAMMDRQYKQELPVYPPGFLYRYKVAGIEHVNSTRRFRTVHRAGNDGAEEAAPSNLPVGTAVRVAYCPDDPDVSALEPGVDGMGFVLPAIGSILLIAGCSILIRVGVRLWTSA
ncbi:MAG TPA: DUF3592 domain-containing protein [Bryobacteraceae bacterium]|nr:DUF3592 domain-containing protein [Bryobacteraceae bacterium]